MTVRFTAVQNTTSGKMVTAVAISHVDVGERRQQHKRRLPHVLTLMLSVPSRQRMALTALCHPGPDRHEHRRLSDSRQRIGHLAI